MKKKLNTRAQVVKVQAEVDKAFKVFVKAHDKVSKAVTKLNCIVVNSENKVKEFENKIATEVQHKEHALVTLAQHNEMLDKLSTFLPKKP